VVGGITRDSVLENVKELGFDRVKTGWAKKNKTNRRRKKSSSAEKGEKTENEEVGQKTPRDEQTQRQTIRTARGAQSASKTVRAQATREKTREEKTTAGPGTVFQKIALKRSCRSKRAGAGGTEGGFAFVKAGHARQAGRRRVGEREVGGVKKKLWGNSSDRWVRTQKRQEKGSRLPNSFKFSRERIVLGKGRTTNGRCFPGG